MGIKTFASIVAAGSLTGAMYEGNKTPEQGGDIGQGAAAGAAAGAVLWVAGNRLKKGDTNPGHTHAGKESKRQTQGTADYLQARREEKDMRNR